MPIYYPTLFNNKQTHILRIVVKILVKVWTFLPKWNHQTPKNTVVSMHWTLPCDEQVTMMTVLLCNNPMWNNKLPWWLWLICNTSTQVTTVTAVVFLLTSVLHMCGNRYNKMTTNPYRDLSQSWVLYESVVVEGGCWCG